MLFEDVSGELIELRGAFNSLARDVRRSTPANAKRNKADRDEVDALLWRALAASFQDCAAMSDPAQPKAAALERFTGKSYFADLASVSRLMVRQKAAVAPASTGTSGWAQELVVNVTRSFYDALATQSAFGTLASAGGGRVFNPAITDPSVAVISPSGTRPQINATFVAELAPYPTRRGTFAAGNFGPKKAGTLTYYSEELAERTPLLLEQILRDLIVADTGLYFDSILTDTNAATTIRPAGLRSYGAAITAATGSGKGDLMQTDLGALIAAVQPARRLAALVNPAQAASLAMQFYASPLLVLASTAVPARVVIVVDLDSLAIALWGGPSFVLSSEAAFHTDDNPLPLSAAGSPNTVAAPLRAMWQENEIALKFTQYCNWTLTRTAGVAWTQTVGW